MRNRTLTTFLFVGGVMLPSAALAQAEPGAWASLIGWIFDQQRVFQQGLTTTMRALAQDNSAAALWALLVTGFVYGIFHAAGPGHGKVVLTTYLLTQRQAATHRPVLRGMGLAGAAAFMQGLVALVLVYGLVYLAGWLPRDTASAVDWSERASFGLVAVMGAYLAYRALRGAIRTTRHADHAALDAACDHCGHGQVAPTPDQIARASSPLTAIAAVFSMGLRPCSGAVLVLIFARVVGLPWAGVAAVAAIAAGTAITVGSLAFIAVNVRRLSAATVGSSGRWRFSVHAVGFGGGAFLLAVGASLLAASFAPPHPLGL